MDTPQNIIYSAWRNTLRPIIYETADAKGNPIKKEVDFAVPERNKNYDGSYSGPCNLCGQETNGGIPIKNMFSSNYMDWALHKEPEATHICKACAFCLGMNPAGRIALFRYPLVAEKTLHLCNKKQFRDFILNPPESPFVMIFPTSQKKHLFSKAKVSYSQENYFCNLEEIVVPVNKKIKLIVENIEALRGVGFRVADISAGRIPGNITKKYGFSHVGRLVNIMSDIKRSEMFPLALEVAQKTEEEKAECYLDLTRKTK